MSNLRQAAQQALNDICGAKLCEVNSMSSRVEMLRLMDRAITNLRAALAEPEQEPVVWMYQDKSTHEVRFQKHMRDFVDHGQTYETPLYTAPTPRKPLTDEAIWREYQGLWPFHPAEEPALANDILKFARAIERAHGIGEQT